MKKISDGHTENGTRVEVWRADSDSEIVRSLVKNYADLGPAYRVLIDNVPVEVTSQAALRDGGTVYLKLATGQTIHYPAPERGEPRSDPNPVPTPILCEEGSPRGLPARRAVKSPIADSLRDEPTGDPG